MRIINFRKNIVRIILLTIVLAMVMLCKKKVFAVNRISISKNKSEYKVGETVEISVNVHQNDIADMLTKGISVREKGILANPSYAPETGLVSFQDYHRALRSGDLKLRFKAVKSGTTTVTWKIQTGLGKRSNNGKFSPLVGDDAKPVTETETITIVVKEKAQNPSNPSVKPTPKPDPKPEEKPKTEIPKVNGITSINKTYVATEDDINVRPHNSLKYPRIGKLNKGDEIQATGEIGEWLCFQYEGKTAFAYKSYFKENTEEKHESEKKEEKTDESKKNVSFEIKDKKEQQKELKEKFDKIPQVGLAFANEPIKNGRTRNIALYILLALEIITFVVYNINTIYLKKGAGNNK